jgi:hypothetical protein
MIRYKKCTSINCNKEPPITEDEIEDQRYDEETPEEMIEGIRASRPAGYFDHTERLLHSFVAKNIECNALVADIEKAAEADDWEERVRLGGLMLDVHEDIVHLADVLGLWPEDQLPTPRLQ